MKETENEQASLMEATKEEMCRRVWLAGQEYSEKPKGNRKVRNPVHLIKLFYWIYLTASYPSEPFLEPYPSIRINNSATGTFVEIEHADGRSCRKGAKRGVVRPTIPIMDIWEKRMWNYLTDGGTVTDPSEVFGYGKWNSIKPSSITMAFKRSFKIEGTDSVTPTTLRYLRAFNVAKHNVPSFLVKEWFRWNDRMLEYHKGILANLKQSDQVEVLRAFNLLTKLRIDEGILLSEEPVL